jgi:hypothetical protein
MNKKHKKQNNEEKEGYFFKFTAVISGNEHVPLLVSLSETVQKVGDQNIRRGARVVESDGLENRCARKCTVGSNPTLSATVVKAVRKTT